LKEWEQHQEEENKYVEEELKEYEKKKSELKGAIKANNFKLDDAYKQELSLRAKTIAESVHEGAKANNGAKEVKQNMTSGGPLDKREKKKAKKFDHLICADLDNF
jgi:hypothetical protein